MKKLPISLITLTSVFSYGCFSSSEETTSAAPVENTEKQDDLKSATNNLIGTIADKVASGDLSQIKWDSENITKGLKDTLSLAAKNSIMDMGKNSNFSIDLPESLEQLKGPLAKLGQNQLFDTLSNNMGSVATSVIGQSGGIFENAIKNIKIDSPEQILNASPTATTDLLKQQSFNTISSQLLPIVTEATSKLGTTDIMNSIKGTLPQGSGSLLGGLSKMAGIQFPQNLDINQYITNATLNKVFDLMASQEKNIRSNPEQATDFIQSMFNK